MKVANWKQFITTHPDTEELCKAAPNLHALIDPEDTTANNMDRICASESIVIVTADAINGSPSPVFHHHRLGLPIPGIPKRLVGLTGFDCHAYPVAIDADRLFTMTENEIPTPSLQEFFSKAENGLTELKTIQPTANVTHKIRLAAILIPQLTAKVTELESVSAWDLLFQAIKTIKQLKPIVVEGENETETEPGADAGEEELDYAKEYMPLLTSLWSFTRSTEETKNIVPPRRALQVIGRLRNGAVTYTNNTLNPQQLQLWKPPNLATTILPCWKAFIAWPSLWRIEIMTNLVQAMKMKKRNQKVGKNWKKLFKKLFYLHLQLMVIHQPHLQPHACLHYLMPKTAPSWLGSSTHGTISTSSSRPAWLPTSKKAASLAIIHLFRSATSALSSSLQPVLDFPPSVTRN